MVRLVNFPRRGRPTETDRRNLDELVMVTQVALAAASIERWALSRVAHDQRRRVGSSVPAELRESAKRHQYEVSVVEAFLRLGAQSFAANQTEALWERQFRHGNRGRPISVDIALFNEARGEEAWIEFGEYSAAKVKNDSEKLLGLEPAPGFRAARFIIVYDQVSDRATAPVASAWMAECGRAASRASESLDATVRVRVASVMDAAVVDLAADAGNATPQGVVRTAIFSVGSDDGAVPTVSAGDGEHSLPGLMGDEGVVPVGASVAG